MIQYAAPHTYGIGANHLTLASLEFVDLRRIFDQQGPKVGLDLAVLVEIRPMIATTDETRS